MTNPVIVVGFDGSDSNRPALAFASDIAKKYGAIVHVVHVIDWSPFDLHTMRENSVQATEMKEQVRKDRDALFPPVVKQFQKAGVEAEPFTTFGDPADSLAAHAEQNAALAIVVGRRGGSPLKRMLLGSVARGLVNFAHGPVIVVP